MRSRQGESDVAPERTPSPRRRHLRRLDAIFPDLQPPLVYITVCTLHRMRVLATPRIAQVLAEELRAAWEDYGWRVGRHVIMPDHVHFFAMPEEGDAKTLSSFVGYWKRGTRRLIRESGCRLFAWQPEFFDHVLRRRSSYARMWEYVQLNPVRERLVTRPEDWRYQGEISELRW